MFQYRPAPKTPPTAKKRAAYASRLAIEAPGTSIEIEHSIMIGRGTDCDLTVADPSAATRHAEIYPVGPLWWVRDLGSDNGTFLDGEIIEAAPLAPRGQIKLGVDGPAIDVRWLYLL